MAKTKEKEDVLHDKDLNLEREFSDNLRKARCRLTVREPWYGSFAVMMDWKADPMTYMEPERRTMGVRIMDNGRIECIYNPEFAAKLSIEKAYAIVKHEIEHIVRLHPVRRGDRNPYGWNIAADMCVNGKRSNPICIYKENGVVVVPGENCIWKPEDWEDSKSAEYYYDKFPKEEEQKKCAKCKGKGKVPDNGQGQEKGKGKGKGEKGEGEGQGEGGQGQGEGQGEGGGGKGEGESGEGGGQGQGQGQGQGEKQCPDCQGSGCGGGEGQYSEYGDMVDNHDIWNESTMSEDEARQIVKDMTDQATAKSQGHAPGHLSEALNDLNKPVVRWREIVRQFFGRHVGNRRKTYARRNRRIDTFGSKGVSHHAAATLGVIIDTSGSVGKKELEQFFGEIEALSARAKIWLLQWDHAFQGLEHNYRRGDWKKIKIKGRGGTDMIAPIKFAIDNLEADAVVMLTDGYCQYPDTAPPFPMIICITTKEPGPSWANNIEIPIA